MCQEVYKKYGNEQAWACAFFTEPPQVKYTGSEGGSVKPLWELISSMYH